MGSVGVMPLRCDGYNWGEWPGPTVGLSLPVTLNESWRVTCSMCNITRLGKSEWEEIKRTKDPAIEGGWEGTPQLSRVRTPSEDWMRGVFRNPPWARLKCGVRKYRKQKPKKNIIYKETRANLLRLHARVKRMWLLISRSYVTFCFCYVTSKITSVIGEEE